MVEEEKEEEEEEEEGLAIAGQADVSASWACQQFWQADSSAGCSRLATGPTQGNRPLPICTPLCLDFTAMSNDYDKLGGSSGKVRHK